MTFLRQSHSDTPGDGSVPRAPIIPTNVLFTAVILAGVRADADPDDPVAGNARRAAIRIGGRPMIDRVIATLRQSANIANIVVIGGEGITLPADITRLEPAASPCQSLLRAEAHLGHDRPLLITTADHPLLTPEMVDHFCTRSRNSGADLCVGMVSGTTFRARFGNARRTMYQFRDDFWCSCNLYSLNRPQAFDVIGFWRTIEANRKKPWKVISAFGPIALALVALKRWSLGRAVRHASAKLGVDCHVIPMNWAEAAVDVDSLGDLEMVENLLAETGAAPQPG